MFRIKNNLFKGLLLVAVVAVIVGSILTVNYYVMAWIAPDQHPPDGGPTISGSPWQDSIITPGDINYDGGNVGIGNTSPAYKLDVNGDINFTGILSKNGSQLSGDELQDNTIDSSEIEDDAVGLSEIISSQVQERVDGTCPVGESIRVINSDGTVSCEVDNNSTVACSWSGWYPAALTCSWGCDVYSLAADCNGSRITSMRSTCIVCKGSP